jgi:hypothetical protein
MGPEIAIPLILSAVGTGAQVYASDRASKKQQAMINAQDAQRQQATNRVVTDIEAEAPRYTQENVQAETGDVQAATEDRLLNDLKTALGPNTREAPIGKVSEDYITKKAEREGAEVARNTNLAKLFAAIDAPNQTRLKQSMDAADARARRNAVMAGSNAYGANVQAEMGKIHPDSTLTTAGGALSGAAGAYSDYAASERLKKALGPQIFGAG